MGFENKFLALLRSRKFWASLLGLISIGALLLLGVDVSDAEIELMVDAIMVIVGIFTFSTAVEDGLSRRV